MNVLAGEGTINVRIFGDGEPALLFVHGFSCSLDDWDSQVQYLSREFQCVSLDLPGHGDSAPPDAPTLSELGAAVNVAKDRSGARQVVLIGHSLGAKVIREAYWQSPERVAGLILIDGAFYDGDRDTLVTRARAAIDAAGFESYARQHFAGMFLPGTDPSVSERIIRRTLQIEPGFGRSLYLEAVGWDPVRGQETLRRLAVPVLVLQATDVDSHFQRRALQPGATTPFMQTVTRLVPDAEARVIAGSGHFPMLDAPDAVNAEIRKFARRVAMRFA